MQEQSSIKVAVRVRPLLPQDSGPSCVECSHNSLTIRPLHRAGRIDSQGFWYDHVFDSSVSQQQLFSTVAQPVLDKALDGYNGTIFAYGQTGSGKTHCMMGEGDGIIPALARGLFHRISAATELKFLVQVSYFEVYNEVVYDLLGPRRRCDQLQGLEVREDKALGVFVKGLQEIVVDSHARIAQLLEQGTAMRASGSTNMNEHSSRSHSVFQVKIHQKDSVAQTSVFAKMNLVDLAGSERASRTGASGGRLLEGAHINQSLMALGNVINALAEVSRTGKRLFVPFRNSKLTRVLQESLGGNSLTSMLATVSPCSSSFDETVSTLKYADRAKAIRMTVVKNEEVLQIDKLKAEIAMLRGKLSQTQQLPGGLDTEAENRFTVQIKEYEEMLRQTWEDKQALSVALEAERERVLCENREHQSVIEQEVFQERHKRMLLLEEKADVMLTVRQLGLDDSEHAAAWVCELEQAAGLCEEVARGDTVLCMYEADLEDGVTVWCERCEDRQHAVIAAMSQQLRTKVENLHSEATAFSVSRSEATTQIKRAQSALSELILEAEIEEEEATPLTDRSGVSLEVQPRNRVAELSLVQKQLGELHRRLPTRAVGLNEQLAGRLSQSVLSMLAREEKDGSSPDVHSHLVDLAQRVIHSVETVHTSQRGKPPSYGSLSRCFGPTLANVPLKLQEQMVHSVQELLHGVEGMTRDKIAQIEQLGQTSLRRSEERVRKLRLETEKLRQDLLAASTALTAASSTIADKQQKLTEVKRAKKRLEQEFRLSLESHKAAQMHVSVRPEESAGIQEAIEEVQSAAQAELAAHKLGAAAAAATAAERIQALELECAELSLACSAANNKLQQQTSQTAGEANPKMQSENLRLRARLERGQERQQSTEARLHDVEQCLRSERISNTQLKCRLEELAAQTAEQLEMIAVLTEERDNARDKEEEYWQRLQERKDAEESTSSVGDPWKQYLQHNAWQPKPPPPKPKLGHKVAHKSMRPQQGHL